MLKNIKKRENLDKEYFIRETPEITDDLENCWYVFEYESKTIPTNCHKYYYNIYESI